MCVRVCTYAYVVLWDLYVYVYAFFLSVYVCVCSRNATYEGYVHWRTGLRAHPCKSIHISRGNEEKKKKKAEIS